MPTQLAQNTINELTNNLLYCRAKNKVNLQYYDGKNWLYSLGIAQQTDKLSCLNMALSWGNVIVEVLNERINLDGFNAPAELQEIIEQIYRDNYLDLEAAKGHRDALIFGCSYIMLGNGDVEEGEPEILVTFEDPNTTYGDWNPRSRRLNNLLKVEFDSNGLPARGVLHLKNETIGFSYQTGSSFYTQNADVIPVPNAEAEWQINNVNIVIHNLGWIPAQPLVNKPRTGKPFGDSEISRSAKASIDAAQRKLTNAETASELFAAPQRYLFNVDLSQFAGKDGKVSKEGFDAFYGKVWLSGMNGDGSTPVAGQFDPSSPAPFIELVRAYIEQISMETGIPMSYLGINTANPASADAIRAQESRLIKRAEERINNFSVSYSEIMKMAVALKTGVQPSTVSGIRPVFRSAASPTRAADTDAAVKLVQAGVLEADSEVVLAMLNLSDSQKATIREERKAKATSQLIQNINALAEQARQNQAINNLNNLG